MDQLNDDCLRNIFAFLSLNDVLNLEFVCPRWHRLQKQLCAKQFSIKIFASVSRLSMFNQQKLIEYDQVKCCRWFGSMNDYLIVSKLDWFIVRHLVTKFPNVKMLLIDGCHVEKCSVLVFLITQWQRHIQCLNLVCLFGDIEWKQILQSIDLLPYLQHLFLFKIDEILILSSKILKLLKEFHLGQYKHDPQPLLVELGSIQKLSLYDTNVTITNLSNIIQNQNNHHSNLTHLAIKLSSPQPLRVERTIFNMICTNMSTLRSLNIYTENGFRVEDLFLLKQLPNLSNITIHAQEKCDLTSNRDYADYEHSNRNEMVRTLQLDIDIDPVTIEVMFLMFPNVENMALNFGRICCQCPELPELMEIPATVQDAINGLNQIIPACLPSVQLPANDREQPQQPEGPLDETQIFEEDNCELCCERAMLAFGSLKSLHKLTITGERCKLSAIKALEQLECCCPMLTCFMFATCVNYSLKHLLNVCYTFASKRQLNPTQKKQMIELYLNEEKCRKIIRLSNKPNNLLIRNVNPIVDMI